MLEGLAEDGDVQPRGTLDGIEITVEPAVVGDRTAHRITENLFG